MSRTKCVVIREEWVTLVGDYKKAIVLGQLMYWSERVKDCALFNEEEQQRCVNQTLPMVHGWFYKRAEDLSEETMMGVKPKAMREYVKHLVEAGWIFEKRPHKLDRTLHYRVNLVKIHHDLHELGYSLKGCSSHSFLPTGENEAPIVEKERAEGVIEATTFSKHPSNHSKKAPATSEKENTPSPETIDAQGFIAPVFASEITRERLQDSETSHTDYTQDVCVRIETLFGKKLSRSRVAVLVDMAKREGTDLDHAIESTYTYHTKVEKCRSIFGAIQYAIENDGWEMRTQSNKLASPLPKAVQRQLDRKSAPTNEVNEITKSDLMEVKEQIRQKMEQLEYVYDEISGQWEVGSA